MKLHHFTLIIALILAWQRAYVAWVSEHSQQCADRLRTVQRVAAGALNDRDYSNFVRSTTQRHNIEQ